MVAQVERRQIMNNTLTKFNENDSKVLNTLPVITWRWLKVNELNLKDVKLTEVPEYNKPYINNYDFNEVIVKKMKSSLKASENIKYFINKEENYGVSEEFVALGDKHL